MYVSNYFCTLSNRGRRGRYCMVVEYTIAYAISAYLNLLKQVQYI